MTTLTSTSQASAGKALRIGLWVGQVLLAIVFIGSGVTKFMTPISDLSHMMPWTGEFSVTFVRFIGLVDLAGGLGILLPSLTRIQPRLSVLAALGCTILQVLAIGFHLSRGEASVLPLNFVLLPLAVFVLWGRGKRAPIGPRA